MGLLWGSSEVSDASYISLWIFLIYFSFQLVGRGCDNFYFLSWVFSDASDMENWWNILGTHLCKLGVIHIRILLTCSSMPHFRHIFSIWYETRVNVRYWVDSASFVKRFFITIDIPCHLCKKSIGHVCVGLFLDSIVFQWSQCLSFANTTFS